MLTIQEIKREIAEEREKYTKPYEKDKGYEMCKEFADKNHFKKGDNFLEIDLWECFKCMLYLKSNKQFSLDKCERLRRICEMSFGPLNAQQMINTMSMLLIISDSDDKEAIIKYFNEENPVIAADMLESIKQPEDSLTKTTKGHIKDEDYKHHLKKLHDLNQSVGVLEEILCFVDEHSHIAAEAFAFVSLRKQMEEGLKLVEEDLEKGPPYLTNREKNKMRTRFFSAFYAIKPVVEASTMIQGFVCEEERKEYDKEKDNQRMIRNYNKVEECLDRVSQEEEIKNPRELVRGIPNEKIKKDILEWVYHHNKTYYDSLESQLKELSSKAINLYIAVLGRYNISLHPKDIQTISHNTPEEIEEILSLIPSGNYEKEDIIAILQGTTCEIAKRVRKYIDLGYITSTKVMEHISIYFHNDMKLDRMASSIEVMQSLGINPKIFRSQPELLWTNNDLFHHNLMVLSTYNLTKNIKNAENYDFLLEEGLEEKIDMWVELGFYSYLEQNLNLLNYSILRIKRFFLLKHMNIPVEDMETIETILENPKFIVNDTEINGFIMNYADYQAPVEIAFNREVLDNFGGDKVSFTIEGETFSIPKFKRRIEQGDSMWEAMFYGRKITEEDYKKVMSILVPNGDCKK